MGLYAHCHVIPERELAGFSSGGWFSIKVKWVCFLRGNPLNPLILRCVLEEEAFVLLQTGFPQTSER